jgi:hypothetical protein
MRRFLLIAALLCFPVFAPAQTCTITESGPLLSADVAATFTNGSAVIAGTNTWNAGQPVQLFVPPGSTLPANFAVGTPYYVIATGLSGTQFELSATVGGSAITAGSAQTGTATASNYSLWPSTTTPNLGDVYQIQGTTPSENYTDDDEANNGYVVFTNTATGKSITVGMFLLNQHVNGVNTFAVRWAAGNAGSANSNVWTSGAWTWAMTYADHQTTPYTCTATGSVTVSGTHGAANGFLRQYSNTPNVTTDLNSALFFPMGQNWYFGYFNGTNTLFGQAALPLEAVANISSGGAVTYVSGTPFNNTTQASSVTPQVYVCPSATPYYCTPWWNVTVNSTTSLTINSYTGGALTGVNVWLAFVRDTATGGGHPLGDAASLTSAAQLFTQWDYNFNRYTDTQSESFIISTTFNNPKYNDYNWNVTPGSTKFGIPAMDLYFAAFHNAGGHQVYGGPDFIGDQPCPSYTCSANQLQNLQNNWAYIAARWGAFVDVFEVSNELADQPQTWIDYIGQTLYAGVTGVAGGNPADPYGHFFTTSWFVNNSASPASYSPTYGPVGSTAWGTADAYLNAIDIPHQDAEGTTAIYSYLVDNLTNVNNCPGNGTGGLRGNNWFAINTENALPLGRAPASQSGTAPNDETNGGRIVNESYVLNQCGSAAFNDLTDALGINSTTPQVGYSWYDYLQGPYQIGQFMSGLDAAAVPITVSLGGGCGLCSSSAMGSNTHIRALIVSNSGNTAGVPNMVTSPTITLTVPNASMTCNWWNPVTGATTACTVPGSGSQTLTYSGTLGGSSYATSPPEIWLALDQSSGPSTDSIQGVVMNGVIFQ